MPIRHLQGIMLVNGSLRAIEVSNARVKRVGIPRILDSTYIFNSGFTYNLVICIQIKNVSQYCVPLIALKC